MSINFDSALGVHADALLLRGKRAEVLANNIANADTPNYKARDFDFAAMQRDGPSQNGSDPVRAYERICESRYGG